MMLAYSALNESWGVAASIAATLPLIKRTAAAKILATGGKVERATEVDAATASTTLAPVYTERAAVRSASNAKETALTALTTFDEVSTFDPIDF
jgi:hypothetical protein